MKELDFSIRTARGAGKIMMRYRGKAKTRFKKDFTIVTEADTAVEKFVRKQIKKKFPSHAIVGEEYGGKIGNGYVWVIDPIDGTTNYARGGSLFSISLALMKNKKLVCGVVYAPALDETYYAARGKGAFLNGEKIRASNKKLSESLVSIGFAIRRDIAKGKKIINLLFPPKVYRFRINESAALSLCYVASGKYDACIDPSLNLWDIAAGALIVEEAGGKVSAFSGRKWNPDEKGILATNPRIHKDIVRILHR
jgi:myo-inositol-1(or 4)-monophosphatase